MPVGTSTCRGSRTGDADHPHTLAVHGLLVSESGKAIGHTPVPASLYYLVLMVPQFMDLCLEQSP